MKKIVIHSAGRSYDRLQIEEGHSIPPSPNEVRITTRYVGVNYADCVVRMGFYSSAKEYVGWPITPGFEFSGVVAEVGSGILDLKVGDVVLGVTRFNAYASEVTVPRHQVYRLPKGMDLPAAAGFPAVYLTAYYGLVELIRLKPRMKVLIHSAAGGVGSAMVQIALAEGCEVTGVVGASHKVELVKRLGAAHVIDKSREDLWQRVSEIAPSGFDVVADANGVETLKQSFKHLASAGKLIIYGFHSMLPRSDQRFNYLKLAWNYLRTPRFNPLELTNLNKSILCFNLSYLFKHNNVLEEGMNYLLRQFEKGDLKSPPITEFEFQNVAEAHRALESGKTQGKLVLRV